MIIGYEESGNFKKFKPGEVVRVINQKSSPNMTVEYLCDPEAAYWTGDEAGIHCVWFSDGRVCRETFHPDVLEIVPLNERY